MQPPPPVDVVLAVPLCLIDGFYRYDMRQTVDDSEAHWGGLAKSELVHIWAESTGPSVTTKQTISILHVFDESSSAGKSLSVFDRTTA